jgi:NitT/TauT family transport system ATP-binding protein
MVLQLEHLSKSYPVGKLGKKIDVLQNVTLDLREGECVALMGANGSGKTTLLRLIAGLDSCSSGQVSVTGHNENHVELMFQDFRATLMPWFTYEYNALGLPTSTRNERTTARELLGTLIPSLTPGSYLSQMSGGEQQAIALIRSLARSVSVLLLDEPFASLDMAVRKRAYAACRNSIIERRTQALLIATHNIEDAATLADRVAILANRPARVFCEIVLPPHEKRIEPGVFGSTIEEIRRKLNDTLA